MKPLGARNSAAVLLGFANICPNAYGAIGRAGELLYGLGDFPSALEASDRMIALAPTNSSPFYLRGRALQGLGRHRDALDALATAVRLVGDTKNVVSDVFMRMSRSYEALDRYCEAMTPIQTYIDGHSEKRDTAALRQSVAALNEKGRCDQTYAKGEQKLPRVANGVVKAKAEINGVVGNFILDTGASFVSLTADFARRAGVDGAGIGTVRLDTSNGTTQGALASLRTVRLGQVRADAVPAVIVERSPGVGVDVCSACPFSPDSIWTFRKTNGR